MGPNFVPLMLINIHFAIKCQKNFARIGVREIGLRSFSIDTGGFFLGRQITFAVFHRAGTVPSRREELKIEAIGGAKVWQKSLSTQPGIPSGPLDLFTFRLHSCCSTSDTDITKLQSPTFLDRNGGTVLPTDWKNL